MHDVCNAGTMPDVLRRDRAVQDEQSGSRMHESKGRVCRIYPESAADEGIQPSGRIDNRRAGRRMQPDDEGFLQRITKPQNKKGVIAEKAMTPFVFALFFVHCASNPAP